MNLICTICARAGSKGLKNKNFLKLFGISLLDRCIKQSLQISKIKNIVVSSDAKAIKKIKNKKILYLKRPKKLSNDKTGKIEVIRHAVKEAEFFFKKKYDVIMDLDVSSPLRKKSDILNCLRLFKKSNSQNLITICKARKNPYFNMIESKNKKFDYVKKIGRKILRRQDAPKVYEMNASIYLWKKNFLNKSIKLFSKKTVCYEMPYSRSIDIDNENDFKIVKTFMRKKT